MKSHSRHLLPLLMTMPILIAGCGNSKSQSGSASASSSAAPASAPAGPYGAAPASTPSSSGSATSVDLTTKVQKKLGGVVLAAGSKRMTVYLFEADKSGHSACSGQCAAVWPPVPGPAKGIGGVKSSLLGTIKLPSGKTQATYAGHPLYFYVRDKDHGDAYGQGIKSFGAAWYTLRPSGSKLDKS